MTRSDSELRHSKQTGTGRGLLGMTRRRNDAERDFGREGEAMSRITAVAPQTAAGRPKELLDAVKQKLGLVPNMTRAMANSPATLDGYLGLSGALVKGTFTAKVREQLALAVSEANSCDYCLAAHTTAGKAVGLTPD